MLFELAASHDRELNIKLGRTNTAYWVYCRGGLKKTEREDHRKGEKWDVTLRRPTCWNGGRKLGKARKAIFWPSFENTQGIVLRKKRSGKGLGCGAGGR